MPTNLIHNWPFHRWEGDRPQLCRDRVATHNVPGVNGVGHVMLGWQGIPFTMEAVKYYNNALLSNAQLMALAMTDIEYVGLFTTLPPVTVVYEGVVLYTFRNTFKITDVSLVECRMIPAAKVESTFAQPACRLRLSVSMTPHKF